MKSRFCIATVVVCLTTGLCLGAKRTEVVIDPAGEARRLNPGLLNGTCVPIWNSKQTYESIAGGLAAARFSLLRFPNGSMSNDYHWNGKGAFNVDSVWECDSADYAPGFVVQTLHRGTSKNHYGFEGASAITDGDTSTFWWSDPLIAETAPWFYLEFPAAVAVDSVVIYWGENHGEDFDVEYWPGDAPYYPGPFATVNNRWIRAAGIRGNGGKTTAIALDSSEAACYWRVRTVACAGSGVQVREVVLYNNGVQVSKNSRNYRNAGQTKVIAISAHPASRRRADFAGGWVNWDFETFMKYGESFPYRTHPVICVNYATGTPQEAAAWVHYANVKKDYRIRYWQVGNEMDGDWEEGGPVSARVYAEKFIAFSRAMKEVDSTILVLGPVMASADFAGRASGNYNDTSWMETFLAYVGAVERTDNRTYCDGVDFHSYPYWFNSKPQEGAMLLSADYVYDRSDRLRSMINAHLRASDSALVLMSEYNSSVQMSSMLHKPINAVCLATMYAGLAEKFGSRAGTVVWDSYEGGGVGPDGTHGSLSLFDPSGDNLLTSMGKPPSAAWWASFQTNTIWLDPDGENDLIPITYDRSTRLRAHAVKTGDNIRVLLINAGFDTLETALSFAEEMAFTEVDIMRWHGGQYAWHGGGGREFAMPNCGPVSRRVAPDRMGSLVVPPVSIVIATFRNAAPANAPPLSAIHVGAWPLTARYGDTVRVWASLRSGAPITDIQAWIDDSAGPRSYASLDGKNDGPFESFVVSFRADSLVPGEHRVVLFASDSAGALWRDTITIKITGMLRPVLLIDNFEDGNLLSSLPGNPAWRRYAHGANGSSVTLSVDSSGGSRFMAAAYSIIQPQDLGYDNFAKSNIPLDSTFMATQPAPLRGIRLRYAATHSSTSGAFFIHANSRLVTDYDEYHVKLENTGGEWKTIALPWTAFVQYGWGVKVAKLSPEDLYDIEFRVSKEGQGTFSVDDLYFISDEGDSVSLRAITARRSSGSVGGISVRPRNSLLEFRWTPSGGVQGLGVFSLAGRRVMEVKLPPGATGYRWLRPSSAGPGVYVVRIVSATGRVERTFTLR